jgi:hypothetical protein
VNDDPRHGLLTGNRCHCRSCGEFFNSTSGFDRHRYGPYGWNTRKCRPVQWMIEQGWQLSGRAFWKQAGTRPEPCGEVQNSRDQGQHRVKAA